MAKMSKVGFEECFLIPVEVYKRNCESTEVKESSSSSNNIGKQDGINPSRQYLLEKKYAYLPADLKMKLFNQARTRESKPYDVEASMDYGENEILDMMPVIKQHHPFINDIMKKYIRHHRTIIDWDPFSFEMMINGRLLPKTNIVRSLQFLMKPEDMNYVRPKGVLELRDALLEINVPSGWIAFNPDDTTGRIVPPAAPTPLVASTPLVAVKLPPTKDIVTIAGRDISRSPSPTTSSKKQKQKDVVSSASPFLAKKKETERRSSRISEQKARSKSKNGNESPLKSTGLFSALGKKPKKQNQPSTSLNWTPFSGPDFYKTPPPKKPTFAPGDWYRKS